MIFLFNIFIFLLFFFDHFTKMTLWKQYFESHICVFFGQYNLFPFLIMLNCSDVGSTCAHAHKPENPRGHMVAFRGKKLPFLILIFLKLAYCLRKTEKEKDVCDSL